MKKIEKKVTVGMPQELYDALKKLAEEDCRSVPSYVRLVLREHIESLTVKYRKSDGEIPLTRGCYVL